MPEAQKHLREYETVFLVKPELTDDNVDQVKEKVRGIVDREGGRVVRFTIWGKKKTMYPIAKQTRAIYVHAHYLGGTALVAEVERNLRNFDEVTRFLSLKLADQVDPATKPTLEDVKLSGDIDERPGVPERDGFRPEGVEEAPPEVEEELPEEEVR
jgi:small subunit ribosomal protein S6